MRYTLLLRDPGDGHVCDKRSFDSPDDAVAADRIVRSSSVHDLELWEGGRLVACAAMSCPQLERIEAAGQIGEKRSGSIWDRLRRVVQTTWRTPAMR